jgi:hypothetical protein
MQKLAEFNHPPVTAKGRDDADDENVAISSATATRQHRCRANDN